MSYLYAAAEKFPDKIMDVPSASELPAHGWQTYGCIGGLMGPRGKAR